jgi:hypothetical protein
MIQPSLLTVTRCGPYWNVLEPVTSRGADEASGSKNSRSRMPTSTDSNRGGIDS